MTSIRKAVKRITHEETVFEKGKNRRIIAKLGSGDCISFRLLGTRFWTDPLSVKDLYWNALKRTVSRTWKEENDKRKAVGRRLKKRPTILR